MDFKLQCMREKDDQHKEMIDCTIPIEGIGKLTEEIALVHHDYNEFTFTYFVRDPKDFSKAILSKATILMKQEDVSALDKALLLNQKMADFLLTDSKDKRKAQIIDANSADLFLIGTNEAKQKNLTAKTVGALGQGSILTRAPGGNITPPPPAAPVVVASEPAILEQSPSSVAASPAPSGTSEDAKRSAAPTKALSLLEALDKVPEKQADSSGDLDKLLDNAAKNKPTPLPPPIEAPSVSPESLLRSIEKPFKLSFRNKSFMAQAIRGPVMRLENYNSMDPRMLNSLSFYKDKYFFIFAFTAPFGDPKTEVKVLVLTKEQKESLEKAALDAKVIGSGESLFVNEPFSSIDSLVKKLRDRELRFLNGLLLVQ